MFKREPDSKRYEPPLINLNNRNSSYTLTIELTGYNKNVLEVGTSTGYISKILRDRGNKVIGVEIDPEAADVAKNYCDQIIIGDIENLELDKIFKPNDFDVVIFADVLEHLKWPDVVLKDIKKYLKPDGYLVISLPNIAHGDIILNLLLGRFKYTEMGLLDISHLRFFTLEDIIRLFSDSGYQISDLQTTIIGIGNTEAKIDFSLVPKEFLEFLESLPHSNSYQFVFRAFPRECGYATNISSAKPNLFEAFNKFKDAHIANLEASIREKDTYIQDIHSGHGWRLLTKYFKVRDRLLPLGTQRRRVYKWIITSLGKLSRYTEKSLGYAQQHGLKGTLGKINNKLLASMGKMHFSLYGEESLPSGSTEKPKPIVDIIIVTFNSQNIIGKCISRIFNSSYDKIGKILVIDNHSNDQTIDTVKKIYSSHPRPISIIANRENFGFGKAANLGAHHSKADLLLILNPDALLYPDTISILVDQMNDFGEKCAAVEARQIPFEHPKLYNPISLDVVWSSACCVLIRKEAFLKVGGFDENIFLYGEDVDLSWRLKNSGRSIKYCPSALVYHEIDPQAARPHQKNYGVLSNLYLRAKYGQKIGTWFVSMMEAVISRDLQFPNVVSVFSYFFKGWANRFRKSKNTDACFPVFGFGYEILRRRGHNVPCVRFTQNDLVSIILRTHNRPELLHRVLINLYNQTYKNIEVIVIEDRTNTAPVIIEKFKKYLNIKYYHYTQTAGRTGALNLGLRNVTGDWIYFLDDDDVIFADTIESLLYHARRTDSLMVYGGGLEMLSDDKWTGFLRYGYFHVYDNEKLKRENFIPLGAFMFHHTLLDKVGLFDEKLEMLEDWDFLRRLSKITNFTFVPKDFVIFLTPLDSSQRLKRQLKLDAAYRHVVEKNI